MSHRGADGAGGFLQPKAAPEISSRSAQRWATGAVADKINQFAKSV